MSIIPASSLSRSDLSRLGNNLAGKPVRSRLRRRNRALTAAVNRSLARVGEQIARLHNPTFVAA